MSISFIFWLLMLLWLLFGFWANWPLTADRRGYGWAGGSLLLFVLLFLLGWKLFGWPIQG